MRFKTFAALTATVALALTGCGNSSSTDQNPAKGATTLTIYSPQGDEKRGVFIAERAKQEIGIDITWVIGGGGELQQRLTAEKNNPQADVVLGLTQPSMYQLKALNAFEAYTPSWAKDLSSQYKDPDGQFHMFWQTPIVLAYNDKAMTSAQAPKAWADLVKPEYRNTYVIGNLSSQTTRAFLVGFLWQYVDKSSGKVSDEGWTQLKALFDNAQPLPEGSLMDWGKVASGELPVVLSWFGGIQDMAKEKNISMAYVNTTGGTPFVMESVAVVAKRPKQELAKKFIDWFGSADFQVAYTKKIGGVTPISNEALAKLDPQVSADIKQFDKQDIDWSVVAANIEGWMEKIQLDIAKG